ncbi:MAG: hypothetical protein JWO11_2938 [Nocardioides sp.]|nr:hypothetical protein [Nocardioides sp.]
MEAHPDDLGFWRPWRIRRLFELALFRSVLPGWATSRWILAQALQHLPDAPGVVASNRVHRALATAIELRGGPQNLPGVDTVDARCRVMDQDWVYRQLHLYELGGLTHFLDRVAPADLVAGADRIRDWAAAPMGGYRLLARDAGTVSWQDLRTRETVRTANIGSAALVMPGECVIGRLVPVEDGVMFESAPLVIAETVAHAVALDPPSWVDTLRSRGGTDAIKSGNVHGLLTDVPTGIWMLVLCDAAGFTDESMPTAEQRASAVLSVARLMLDGAGSAPFDEIDAVDPWACIGAAMLAPGLLVTLADQGRPADRDVLARLGELLAEPAASVCRVLADALGDAA